MSTSSLVPTHLMTDSNAFAITCAVRVGARTIPGVNICVKVNVELHKRTFNHGVIKVAGKLCPRRDTHGCRGATAAVGHQQVVGGTRIEIIYTTTDIHSLGDLAVIGDVVSVKIRSA